MKFTKNFNSSKKKYFIFILLHLIFSGCYCSIDLRRLPEHSWLRLDTSSLVEFCNQFLRKLLLEH